MKFLTAMQHSIHLPSTKSKLLLSNKISCASYFLLVEMTQPPLRFLNSKFLNFSAYFILQILKQPISIKKALRRFTKPESDFRFVQFFFYTLVYLAYSFFKLCRCKVTNKRFLTFRHRLSFTCFHTTNCLGSQPLFFIQLIVQ